MGLLGFGVHAQRLKTHRLLDVFPFLGLDLEDASDLCEASVAVQGNLECGLQRCQGLKKKIG